MSSSRAIPSPVLPAAPAAAFQSGPDAVTRNFATAVPAEVIETPGWSIVDAVVVPTSTTLPTELISMSENLMESGSWETQSHVGGTLVGSGARVCDSRETWV